MTTVRDRLSRETEDLKRRHEKALADRQLFKEQLPSLETAVRVARVKGEEKKLERAVAELERAQAAFEEASELAGALANERQKLTDARADLMRAVQVEEFGTVEAQLPGVQGELRKRYEARARELKKLLVGMRDDLDFIAKNRGVEIRYIDLKGGVKPGSEPLNEGLFEMGAMKIGKARLSAVLRMLGNEKVSLSRRVDMALSAIKNGE